MHKTETPPDHVPFVYTAYRTAYRIAYRALRSWFPAKRRWGRGAGLGTRLPLRCDHSTDATTPQSAALAAGAGYLCARLRAVLRTHFQVQSSHACVLDATTSLHPLRHSSEVDTIASLPPPPHRRHALIGSCGMPPNHAFERCDPVTPPMPFAQFHRERDLSAPPFPPPPRRSLRGQLPTTAPCIANVAGTRSDNFAPVTLTLPGGQSGRGPLCHQLDDVDHRPGPGQHHLPPGLRPNRHRPHAVTSSLWCCQTQGLTSLSYKCSFLL